MIDRAWWRKWQTLVILSAAGWIGLGLAVLAWIVRTW